MIDFQLASVLNKIFWDHLEHFHLEHFQKKYLFSLDHSSKYEPFFILSKINLPFLIFLGQKVQVNLFQKLATSAEHVVYQNCSECQNKTKATICVHNMFCRYSELTIFMNNEQSVLILWVSWCKNKSFWQRFTCIS